MKRSLAWSLAGAACVAVAVLLAGWPWAKPRSSPDRAAVPRLEGPAAGAETDPSRTAPAPPRSSLHDAPPVEPGSPPMTEQQIIHGGGPLRERLLAIPHLAEKVRQITAWRLGEELGKSRDCLDEVLGLLHDEVDPAVLSWLAETIRGGRGALAKLTDEEWVRLAPVLLYGQPAERRRAVAGVHSEYMRTPPPEILDALRQCVKTERDPEVLAVVTRGLLVLVAGWDGMADDLCAVVGRMPAGARRREVTYVAQRFVHARVLEARFRAARDAAERDDWAYAIEIAWSQGSAEDGNAPDAMRFAAVYTGVADREVRKRLLRTCPPDQALIRELRAWEPDPALREALAKMLRR